MLSHRLPLVAPVPPPPNRAAAGTPGPSSSSFLAPAHDDPPSPARAWALTGIAASVAALYTLTLSPPGYTLYGGIGGWLLPACAAPACLGLALVAIGYLRRAPLPLPLPACLSPRPAGRIRRD